MLPHITPCRTLCTDRGLSPSPPRVFVFADPAVFPDSLVTGVVADLEPAATAPGELDPVGVTVLHTLQAAMGESCNGAVLKQALQVGYTVVVGTERWPLTFAGCVDVPFTLRKTALKFYRPGILQQPTSMCNLAYPG